MITANINVNILNKENIKNGDIVYKIAADNPTHLLRMNIAITDNRKEIPIPMKKGSICKAPILNIVSANSPIPISMTPVIA